MVKFFLQVLVLGGVFWCGYYVGQQPPGEVTHHLQTISEDMVEKAFGVERGKLIIQQEMLKAKARFLESKSAMIDGQYQKAAQELDGALVHLKNAVRLNTRDRQQTDSSTLMTNVKELQESLNKGKAVSREKLESAQEELDRLLAR